MKKKAPDMGFFGVNCYFSFLWKRKDFAHLFSPYIARCNYKGSVYTQAKVESTGSGIRDLGPDLDSTP